jgi:DNA polymerase kappa
MRTLPIRKVSGIGKVTEKVLNAFGITMCGELYEKRSLLYQVFSEHSALWFISVALGIGSTSTQKYLYCCIHLIDVNERKKRQRKSISTERTFSNLERKEEILELLGRFSEKLAAQLKEKNLQAKIVSVKLKEVNFAVSSKSVTLTKYDIYYLYTIASHNSLRCISSAEDIYKVTKYDHN